MSSFRPQRISISSFIHYMIHIIYGIICGHSRPWSRNWEIKAKYEVAMLLWTSQFSQETTSMQLLKGYLCNKSTWEHRADTDWRGGGDHFLRTDIWDESKRTRQVPLVEKGWECSGWDGKDMLDKEIIFIKSKNITYSSSISFILSFTVEILYLSISISFSLTLGTI